MKIRIALAQINSTVGDLEGNKRKILKYINKAKEFKVDIISFPELSICGYPPEGLLSKPTFIKDNLEKLRELKEVVFDIVAIVGFVDRKNKDIYNACAVIYNKKIMGIYHKILLSDNIFDERHYFKPGDRSCLFKFGKCIFGVNIGEDLWDREDSLKKQLLGAKLIFNINASPYYIGKKEKERLKEKARKNKVFIAWTNLVGGQDEYVFDGQSMVVDISGNIISHAEAFKEELNILDLDIQEDKIHRKDVIKLIDRIILEDRPVLFQKKAKALKPIEEIYKALILGLYDYVNKNGFQKVVIGLSGGIDSSLVATIAKDALGEENVIGVFMPSRYSSKESFENVRKLGKNLGIKLLDISIEEIYKTYLSVLEPQFLGLEMNVTEENLQARIRQNILMALSNKFGWLVLATGNKSEMDTGYTTLYGDMAGGFAILKDIPKTLLYKLAKYRNSISFVIPPSVLERPPSAELKPDQKDTDTLPPYETLDPILKAYIEENKDLNKIVSLGFPKEIVSKVLNLVDKSEYKRRQSPPGIKITQKLKKKKMPITNKYIN